MTKNIEYATQLYQGASLAEEQGNFECAEMLYMESRRIFEHTGDTYQLDAANIMNAVALMKQKIEDHHGTLAAAQETLKILGPVRCTETHAGESEIRLRAWRLIGSAYRHLARYEEAEQILQNLTPETWCVRYGLRAG